MAKLTLKEDSYDFIQFTGENIFEVADFLNDLVCYYESLGITEEERENSNTNHIDGNEHQYIPCISGLHRNRDDRDVEIGEYIVYFYENKEYIIFSKYQFEQTFNIIKNE
jgi:hypothetical protein